MMKHAKNNKTNDIDILNCYFHYKSNGVVSFILL
jgi:hypothetical protein